MSDVRELYQETILDHGSRPRNFRPLEGAARTAEGYNPLCGDRVTVYLRVVQEVIEDIAFQGTGCAISTASASMMTTNLKGKTVVEAEGVFERFHKMVTGATEGAQAPEELGSLRAFAGIRGFPSRVKCATLAWHTFRAALKGGHTSVSTE